MPPMIYSIGSLLGTALYDWSYELIAAGRFLFLMQWRPSILNSMGRVQTLALWSWSLFSDARCWELRIHRGIRCLFLIYWHDNSSSLTRRSFVKRKPNVFSIAINRRVKQAALEMILTLHNCTLNHHHVRPTFPCFWSNNFCHRNI